nr:retrovirus-related Pol polyprotein from transposon TNT 1-94 [Tanacetum cinerariifolium]
IGRGFYPFGSDEDGGNSSSRVEENSGWNVKIVRSDNALEFVKGQCGPYLDSQGSVHQTSCVDRPQQNVRVERKHMHALYTGRALRFYSKLPLKF